MASSLCTPTWLRLEPTSAPGGGFEPPLTEPKSVVLPGWTIRDRTTNSTGNWRPGSETATLPATRILRSRLGSGTPGAAGQHRRKQAGRMLRGVSESEMRRGARSRHSCGHSQEFTFRPLRNLRSRRLRLRKRTGLRPRGGLPQGRTWQVLRTHVRRRAQPSHRVRTSRSRSIRVPRRCCARQCRTLTRGL